MLRKVYNLEVEDNHTYFVGEAGVLVHNTSGEALVKLKNQNSALPKHCRCFKSIDPKLPASGAIPPKVLPEVVVGID